MPGTLLITAAEAAEILGVQLQAVYDCDGNLTRHAARHVRRANDYAEKEVRSLAQVKRQHHVPHPYWTTTRKAAALGVSAGPTFR